MKKLFFILTTAFLLIATACSGLFIDPGMSDQPGQGGGGSGWEGEGEGGGYTPTPPTPPTPPSPPPIPLADGTWKVDDITSNQTKYYSFNVIAGTSYFVWWNDSGEGNGRTARIYVSAYYSNNSSIFYNVDLAWNSPQSFTASSNDTVKIAVRCTSEPGDFSIVYNTTGTRP